MQARLVEPRGELVDARKTFDLIGYFWVGGSDLAVEGEWRWESNANLVAITSFSPGQPNGGSTDENCAIMGPSGFEDIFCERSYEVVCEF